MAEKLELDFKEWDPASDILLDQPGNTTGYSVITAGARLTRQMTRKQDERHPLNSEAVDGIIGLLAGGLEWLRWFGYSPEQIQSKIKAYIQANKDKELQQLKLRAYRTTELIGDPEGTNQFIDKTTLPPWVRLG